MTSSDNIIVVSPLMIGKYIKSIKNLRTSIYLYACARISGKLQAMAGGIWLD